MVLQILAGMDPSYDYGDFSGIQATNEWRQMGNEQSAEKIKNLAPDCFGVLIPALVKSPVVFSEILRRAPSEQELTDSQWAAKFVLLRMGSDAVLKLLKATESRQFWLEKLGADPVTETLCAFGDFAFPETIIFLIQFVKGKQIETSVEANQIESCLEVVRKTGVEGLRALCAIGDAKQWSCLGQLLRKLAVSPDFHPVITQVLEERLPSWFKIAPKLQDVVEMLNEISDVAAPCVRRIAFESAYLPSHYFEAKDNSTGRADVLYRLAIDCLMAWKQVDDKLALMIMERFIFDNDSRELRNFKELPLKTREGAVELFNSKHARKTLNNAAGEFERVFEILKGDGLIKFLTVGNDVYMALKDCVEQRWGSDRLGAEPAEWQSQKERYGVEIFTLKYLGCVFDVATLTRFKGILKTPGLAEAIQKDEKTGVQKLPRTELS